MSEKEKQFRDFSAKLLAKVYSTLDHERIYSHLLKKEKALEAVFVDTFGLEYLAACLALSVKTWLKVCSENGVDDPAIQKTFLKGIMDSFQSPKFLNIATTFSEYLYGQGQDQEEGSEGSESLVVLLAKHLTKKLQLRLVQRTASKEERLGIFFEDLVKILEGFRAPLENEIFEFIAAARFRADGPNPASN